MKTMPDAVTRSTQASVPACGKNTPSTCLLASQETNSADLQQSGRRHERRPPPESAEARGSFLLPGEGERPVLLDNR